MSTEVTSHKSVFERGRYVSLPRADKNFTTTPSLFLAPEKKPALPEVVHTLPRGVWARNGSVPKPETNGNSNRMEKFETEKLKTKKSSTVWMPPNGMTNDAPIHSQHDVTSNELKATSSLATFSITDKDSVDELTRLPASLPAIFSADHTPPATDSSRAHKFKTEAKLNADGGMFYLSDVNASFPQPEVETAQQFAGGTIVFYEDYERPTPQQAVSLYTAAADDEVPRDWQNIAARFFAILNSGQSWTPPRVTLVTDYLLLGGFEAASDVNFLIEKKVTHVLNAAGPQTTSRLRHLLQGNFTYMEIASQDIPSYDISQHFIRAHSFIERCRSSGGRVLVHCMAGINRSSSLVLSHLLFEGHDLIQATEVLKRTRGMFLTNPSFQMHILQLARQLSGQV